MSTFARSDLGIPSWTPCENGIVSTEMPKRKLTKVEDCLLTNGITIDAIKCLNWKYMDTHPGKCYMLYCSSRQAEIKQLTLTPMAGNGTHNFFIDLFDRNRTLTRSF